MEDQTNAPSGIESRTSAPSGNDTGIRFVARFITYSALLAAAVVYPTLAVTHKDYHPIRLIRATEARGVQIKQENQAAIDKVRREEERYDELVDQLFGENGVADRNNDRFYSPEELADAYRRMGARFDRTYANGRWHQGWTMGFERRRTFPIPDTTHGFLLDAREFPTASELEMAIKSFQTGQTQR